MDREEPQDRTASDEAARRESDQLAADLADTELLRRVSAEMIHEDDVGALYEKIVDAAVAVMRSDFASMQRVEAGPGGEHELRLLAFRGFTPEAAHHWQRVRAADGSTCGAALHLGERVVVPDIEACDFMAGTEDLATYRQTGIRSVQSTPLFSRAGALVGMISTHWRRPHRPSERDLRLVDVLSRQAADLIERTRTIAELATSEERFRTLADLLPQMVFVTGPDGAFDLVNRRWHDYTGVGVPAPGDGTRFVHPDDVDRAREAWRAAFAEGRPFEGELRMRRAEDGAYRWFLSRAVPIRDGDGRITRWFGTATDIDDQKRLEQALRDQDRRKDEFLAMLGHELGGPLAQVRTSVAVLEARMPDDRLRPQLASLAQQVATLAHLVEDLLDVSRLTHGVIELRRARVDARPVVQRAFEAVRALMEQRRHQVTVATCMEPLPVVWDPVRLEQVVVNLLTNAAKFTDPRGRVALSVRRDGDHARIHVGDSGIGIAPEMLGRIFDLFEQAGRSPDRAQGGLGVGLTLVKTLVELHGGTVEAHSEGIGKGAELTVRLPLAPVEESALAGGARGGAP